MSMPVVAAVSPARISVQAGTTAGTALRDTGLPNKGPDAIVVASSLTAAYATKRSEFAEGIGRLWSRTDLPPPVADYVAEIRRLGLKDRDAKDFVAAALQSPNGK